MSGLHIRLVAARETYMACQPGADVATALLPGWLPELSQMHWQKPLRSHELVQTSCEALQPTHHLSTHPPCMSSTSSSAAAWATASAGFPRSPASSRRSVPMLGAVNIAPSTAPRSAALAKCIGLAGSAFAIRMQPGDVQAAGMQLADGRDSPKPAAPSIHCPSRLLAVSRRPQPSPEALV